MHVILVTTHCNYFPMVVSIEAGAFGPSTEHIINNSINFISFEKKLHWPTVLISIPGEETLLFEFFTDTADTSILHPSRCCIPVSELINRNCPKDVGRLGQSL